MSAGGIAVSVLAYRLTTLDVESRISSVAVPVTPEPMT